MRRLIRVSTVCLNKRKSRAERNIQSIDLCCQCLDFIENRIIWSQEPELQVDKNNELDYRAISLGRLIPYLSSGRCHWKHFLK